ncbi:MAG: hypothetical protein ACNI3H_05905 [Halarcobacter ebronensis]
MNKRSLKRFSYTFIPALLIVLIYLFVDFALKKYFLETKQQASEDFKTINNTNQNIDKTAKIIAKSSVIYLSNFAIDGLKDKIELDFQNNFIEAIEIKDIYLNENLISAYRNENNQVVFTNKLPAEI